MVKRKIVEIDEDKCNGCGKCIPNCHEGALQIIDGKARLVSDSYCDGLGACLGTCPQDAIKIAERQADPFDEEAVQEHLKQEELQHSPPAERGASGGCPGAAAMELDRDKSYRDAAEVESNSTYPSALTQWPIQLHLVPVSAPYFDNADLLLAADCVPFAFNDFHQNLLEGRKVLIGCPKLDDGEFYRDKLMDILKNNNIRSLTVAHMEVPCCHGLLAIAKSAVEKSGSDLAVNVKEVSIRGKLKE